VVYPIFRGEDSVRQQGCESYNMSQTTLARESDSRKG
jgi:hypothetical protein